VVAEMQKGQRKWEKCLVLVILSLALASWLEEGVKNWQYHTWNRVEKLQQGLVRRKHSRNSRTVERVRLGTMKERGGIIDVSSDKSTKNIHQFLHRVSIPAFRFEKWRFLINMGFFTKSWCFEVRKID
jgi:hypothetical protein